MKDEYEYEYDDENSSGSVDENDKIPMKTCMCIPWVVGAILAASRTVPAAFLPIVNPGFEDPVIAAGTFDTAAPPTGWSPYGYIDVFAGRDLGVLHPATTSLYADPAPEGNNVAVIFLLTGGPTESGLVQTLGDVLQPGLSYTLTVDVGNIAPDGAPFNFTGFPGYRVDLLAGGQIVAFDNNSLLPGEGRFLESTVSFTAAGDHPLLGQPLGVRLVSLDGPNGIEVNFDDVQLSVAAVPEPESFGWVAAGGLMAWAIRRGRARGRWWNSSRCDE